PIANKTLKAAQIPGAPRQSAAHLLAGSGGFPYGNRNMAQRPSSKAGGRSAGWGGIRGLLLMVGFVRAASAAEPARVLHELLQPQGEVEVLRKGAGAWTPARTNLVLFPGDTVRTGKDSRAAIRLSNDSVIRMDQLTIMRLPEPVSP